MIEKTSLTSLISAGHTLGKAEVNLIFKKAPLSVLFASQRLLILFKPDALAKGCVVEGLKLIAQGLAREKIVFRFPGMVLCNANGEFLDIMYREHKGKGWYEGIFKPFMTGNYPNPSVIQAPLLAVMLEIQTDSSRDLISIIRNQIIGPTDPEASFCPNTVRHLLTSAKGFPLWPLGKAPLGPINNRLHCSANLQDAPAELTLFFGEENLLQPHYQAEAAKILLSEWEKTPAHLQKSIIKIPLLNTLGTDMDKTSLKIMGAFRSVNLTYKDFEKNRLESLIRGLNNMQKAFQLQEEFFFNHYNLSGIANTNPGLPFMPIITKEVRAILDSEKTREEPDQTLQASLRIKSHLNYILGLFEKEKGKIDTTDIDTLEKSLFSLFTKPVGTLLKMVRDSITGPIPKAERTNYLKLLMVVRRHTNLVICSGRQLRSHTFEEIIKKPKRFGRLGLAASLERARKIIGQLKSIQALIPEEEELLFDLTHDIGKMENYNEHPEKGAALAEKVNDHRLRRWLPSLALFP